MRSRLLQWFALVLFVVALTQAVRTQSPDILWRLGLSPQEVAAVENGKAVAKVLPWGKTSEMYVFGAVHVNGSPSAYLAAARDVTQLRGQPGYLAVGELSENPRAADLKDLTLDADDIEALKTCREGACDVQLPADAMPRFRDAATSNASVAVNPLAHEMLIELLRAYRVGGDNALGVYQDKRNPALIAEQFETMVGRVVVLPDVLPELREYLLNYPHSAVPAADTFFYWEKVSFGLKPTIRLNHGIIYHTRRDTRDVDVVAIKQLYASHYFHSALDLSVCVGDGTNGASHGFYLLTLKGSEQAGLTGLKGTVLRRIIADKSQSALETALTSIARTLQ